MQWMLRYLDFLALNTGQALNADISHNVTH